MERDFTKEQNYIKAKKRVKAIKGFYVHLMVFVIVNIFISGVVIFGLLQSNYSFYDAITNFGVYSTWLFWGIGMFFHWMGVFGFKSIGFGKDWEEKKIKEFMEK
ncbi:2TM domain-containing protein [Polaribacter undariae]|uniref:2TM domain-containing protein n=1 Tax=Polaribacter sejongensis TaxID=985043 RepID=A0AAJ1VFP1_9FLAO|nr:2TM domain-containing protein [Polaribacter undariae]MDN3618821.1 2TM domain-containing protein [Polaribacter undariae]UWD32911.1 2TM domain-containing protein [Polaribacter undariae]